MGNRTVIVTGGFGALGRVVAKCFKDVGDDVVRIDFAPLSSADPAGTLDIGGVDLADGDAVDTAVRQIIDATGRIDVLVNIAGGFVWETLADGTPDTWERMFTLNVRTTATMSKAALPYLRQSEAGRIVNIGAGAAIQADAGMGAYAAAKSGVHRLTEALSAELAQTGITVNAVLPSIIDTPANRADMPDADTATWVTPQAVADVILYLASPAARSISGALIPISRGTGD